MPPDFGAGDVILWAAVLALLLDVEAIGQLIHPEVAEQPCSPVLDVLALGDSHSDLLEQHRPESLGVVVECDDFSWAYREVERFHHWSLLFTFRTAYSVRP